MTGNPPPPDFSFLFFSFFACVSHGLRDKRVFELSTPLELGHVQSHLGALADHPLFVFGVLPEKPLHPPVRDAAEGLDRFVPHHRRLVRVAGRFDQRRDRVWVRKLAEYECNLSHVSTTRLDIVRKKKWHSPRA